MAEDTSETTAEETAGSGVDETTPQGVQDAETKPAQPAGAKPEDKSGDPEWLQKRIDRAVRRQHEAERETAVYRQMLEAERGRSAQMQQAPAQRQPTAEDFDKLTPAQQAALVAAEVARRAVESERVAAAERGRAEQQHRESAEITRRAQSQIAAGSKKYEDFEEVALSEDVPISTAMASVIAESEHGADIAYFLGKNVKEAERIAKLPPLAAAREIGRLEAKFAASANVSNAPAPGKPVAARGGASSGLRDDMPLSEWMATFDKTMRQR